MKLSDWLSFDKMIVPQIIKIVFYALVILSVLSGLVMIIKGISADYGGGMTILWGLLTLVFGPFWARLSSELMIVLFEIHAKLVSIDKKMKADEK